MQREVGERLKMIQMTQIVSISIYVTIWQISKHYGIVWELIFNLLIKELNFFQNKKKKT